MIFIGNKRVKIFFGREINILKDIYVVSNVEIGINQDYNAEQSGDTLIIG